MSCYQVKIFAAGSDLVKSQYLGVTIGFLNSINMLGGSFFHTAIGRLMDIFWSGAFNNEGIKLYNTTAYQCALMIIPACAILGAAVICLLGLKSNKNLTEER